MAQQREQVREILTHMVEMGWHVHENTNHTTAQVGAPGKPTVTVPIRGAGTGRGLDNAMREIRKTGYFDAWPAFVAQRLDERRAAAQPSQPVPTPAQVFEPVTPELATVNGVRLVGTARDVIDGQRVEDRNPAKGATPGGAVKEISGVDEVMLADGRVVYQCVRSAYCFDAFLAVASARSHLRAHGRPQAAARADKAREAAEEDFEKKSRAGSRGHELRRLRQALLLGDESRAAWLTNLADQLEQVAPVLRELARLRVEVPVLITEEELAELREKADHWDQMQELLGRTGVKRA